jgi:hypothetical protein
MRVSFVGKYDHRSLRRSRLRVGFTGRPIWRTPKKGGSRKERRPEKEEMKEGCRGSLLYRPSQYTRRFQKRHKKKSQKKAERAPP